MPVEITLEFETIGFSSNSSMRQSSFIFRTPKRLVSASLESVHTTVTSARFAIWYSSTLLKSSLYTPSPDAMTTYGSWLFFSQVRFWLIASAVPRYHQLLSDVTVGENTNRPPCFLPKSHHLDELKCSFKDLALYCVRTATFWIWEFAILDSAKSMLRKLPATGIAATALLFASIPILLLFPPAKTIPIALIIFHLPL